MNSLVIYADNGEITQVITGNNDSLSANAKNLIGNYLIHDGSADLFADYVDTATFTVKPKGDQPSDGHIFDYSAGQWVFDIDTARSKKWIEIKAAREAEEFGSFEWGGYLFDCDETSQRRIQGAVQLAQIDSGLTLDWTLADNSVQEFTAAQIIQIGEALANHVSDTHAHGRIRRSEIDSATTQQALEAIVW